MLQETADVVVVGGGINGVCVAYNLAKLGVRRVLLLEKSFLAAGGTGKSAAIVRMHYDNRPEAELAWAAYPTFRHWDSLVGYGTCGFVQTGYLLIPPPRENRKLVANIAMLQDVGIETCLIDRDKVSEMFPALCCDDIISAGWEPLAGYADPSSTVNGIAQAARTLGAEIRQGVMVMGIRTKDDQVVGVSTTAGNISCPVVLLATGGWTSALTAPLGLELPIKSTRGQVFQVKRPSEYAAPVPHPTIMDYAQGIFCRPETGSITIGGTDEVDTGPIDPDRYSEELNADFVERIVDCLPRRMPFMEDALFMGGWAGPMDVTPDRKPILGSAGPEGLFLAVGFSGHGFKTGPAVGKCMAELITEGEAYTVDITPFRPSRWVERKPLISQSAYSEPSR